MAIVGHRSAEMSAVYSRISDPVVKEQYEKVIAAGGRVTRPAADALLTNSLDKDTVDINASSSVSYPSQRRHHDRRDRASAGTGDLPAPRRRRGGLAGARCVVEVGLRGRLCGRWRAGGLGG